MLMVGLGKTCLSIGRVGVIFAALTLSVVASALYVLPVVAAVDCPTGMTPSGDSSAPCKCPDGKQEVSVPLDSSGSHCIDINSNSADISQNPIFNYLVGFIRFLAVGIGLAVTGGIIFGAYLYITARANASQVQQGQTVIINSVIGLLLYIFMFTILQFIIPGGIFQV
jgi:hypothetical protein